MLQTKVGGRKSVVPEINLEFASIGIQGIPTGLTVQWQGDKFVPVETETNSATGKGKGASKRKSATAAPQDQGTVVKSHRGMIVSKALRAHVLKSDEWQNKTSSKDGSAASSSTSKPK